jgi:hypothetical protein
VATLLDTLRRRGRVAERDAAALSFQDWVSFFKFDGLGYNIMQTATLGGKERDISPDFEGYASSAYRQNGVVFACMLSRMMLFAQGRFQYQDMSTGRPGKFFGTTDLAILEKPWGGNSTTSDLLARAIQDVDLAGNFYAVADQGVVRRLPPHYVTIILGSQSDPQDPSLAWDADVIGYIYEPRRGEQPKVFMPEQVAHFAPIPDPLARYRGMSWLTPVLRQITADNAMSTHQLKYFEKGATPNVVVTLDAELSETSFKRWQKMFAEQNEGVANAYKTMILTAGAKPVTVGNNLEDFKTVKGHGETVIAAASGIHPVIIGLSEGLQGSSLNAGNFAAARRVTTDRTLDWLWESCASSFEPLVAPQRQARLAIDKRDIPFCREDAKDASEIQATQANTIHTYIAAGFEPSSVVAAVDANDRSLLAHTGLFSVQLQPAGSLTEGKGSVVQGVPIQKGAAQPALPPGTPTKPAKSNGAAPKADAIALLGPFADQLDDPEEGDA